MDAHTLAALEQEAAQIEADIGDETVYSLIGVDLALSEAERTTFTAAVTSERQQRAQEVQIAELLGWEWQPYDYTSGERTQLLWNPTWPQPSGHDFDALPDGRLFPWDLPSYTSDVRDAEQVVDFFVQRGWRWTICIGPEGVLVNLAKRRPDGKYLSINTEAPTQAAAIALAATNVIVRVEGVGDVEPKK